jgi:hypothetical protein
MPMNPTEQAASEIRDDYLKRHGTPRTELIEAGRVRDFLLALDEAADLEEGQPVPPLFVLTLGRTRRLSSNRGAAVNAGDDFEFYAPVYVGDRITTTRDVLAVEPREGRNGRMYLTRAEARYVNQHGVLVAKARSNILRWNW